MLHYDGAPGEYNQLLLTTEQSGAILMNDPSGMNSGSGCSPWQSQPGWSECSGQGLASVVINFGDMGDTLNAGDLHLPLQVNGGDGDDWIQTGSDDGNVVDGGPGDDVIAVVGSVADDVHGGAGNDTVEMWSGPGDTTITLDDQPGDGPNGRADNIHSDFETVVGGDGNDTIVGTDGPDHLIGRFGNDHLVGNGGDDVLDPSEAGVSGGYPCDADVVDGGDGNDTIGPLMGGDIADGGPGDDTLRAGHGDGCPDANLEAANTIIGGSGTDTVSYADEHAGGVEVMLDGVANDGLPGDNDDVHADVENATGSYSADQLVGNAGPNVLDGGGGDDLLDGGAGADTIRGGDGEDVVDYSTRTAPVHVDIGGASGNDGEAGEGDTVAADVEDIWSGSGDDVLTGNEGDNTIDGGEGADAMSGGGGDDVVDYSTRTAPVTANLGGSAGDDGEVAEHDTIAADFEGIFGGSGNDTLTGAAGDDYLDGGPGADRIEGGAGADLALGGAGDDALFLRDDAADQAACGDGTDVVTADASDDVDPDCESRLDPTPPPTTGTTTTTTHTHTTPTKTAPVPQPVSPTRPSPPPLTTPALAILSLKPASLDLRRVLKKGETVLVSCNQRCATRLQLELSPARARTLGLRHVSKPVIVGSTAHRGTGLAGYLLTIQIAPRYRKLLRHAKSVLFTLRAVSTNSSGDRAARTRTLKLRRR